MTPSDLEKVHVLLEARDLAHAEYLTAKRVYSEIREHTASLGDAHTDAITLHHQANAEFRRATEKWMQAVSAHSQFVIDMKVKA